MAETDVARARTDFLRGLRAVRQYRRTPVPDHVVEDILEVARWSGSASNRQAAEIVVIREAATLKALAGLEGYTGHLAGAPLGMVIVMPGKWIEGDAFDEGRLSERIMLAAAAHGLGSSVGWFTGKGREEAKQLLNVPRERLVRTAIALGYPPEAAGQKRGRRKPLADVVHRERYR